MKIKLLFLLMIFPFLFSCGRQAVLEKESFAFGTRIEVVVAETDRKKAEEAISLVLKEFERLHRTYHAWQPSDLTKVNNAIQNNQNITVSPELADLIQNAKDLSQQTHFLFDPGIGHLIALWGFQNEAFQAQIPEKEKIDVFLKSKPSIQQIEINKNEITSNNQMVSLDLGGYLKGWALDRVKNILKEKNIHNALINIGGNILVLGNKFGRAWRVGIQHPRMPAPLAVLDLNDGEAIGTSGDYQRYFEVDGKRYSHLIHPQTGFPADETQAVTVLFSKQNHAGLYSDVYSKPIFIAGNNWQSTARNLNLKMVLRVNQNGEIEITRDLYQRVEFLMDSEKIKIVDF